MFTIVDTYLGVFPLAAWVQFGFSRLTKLLYSAALTTHKQDISASAMCADLCVTVLSNSGKSLHLSEVWRQLRCLFKNLWRCVNVSTSAVARVLRCTTHNAQNLIHLLVFMEHDRCCDIIFFLARAFFRTSPLLRQHGQPFNVAQLLSIWKWED